MKKFLSKVFNVHEGEHGRVILSWLIFLIVMSGIILGRNARDSIFLKNVGIKYLPYMYVLNAVFVVMVSLVYSSVIDKMDRTKFMIGSTALYTGIIIVSRIMLGMHLQWFYTVCYVIVQILWLIGLMQFWTYMGDVFDARESKRLFPLISTGGLVGMVVSGIGAKYLVAIIGTENLFVVWGAMLTVSIGLIAVLSRKYIKQPEKSAKTRPAAVAQKKSQWTEFKDGFEYIKNIRLLRTMLFINLAMWVVFTIVDYQFNKVIAQTYTDRDQLTAFLGLFRAGAGLLCLIVQLGVTTRLLSALGVGRTIAVHPSFMGVATALMTLKFGFFTASFGKFGDHVLLYTVQDSSYQMLYNPIPPDKRGRARAFVEGYIKPISMGIAGLVLILSALFLTDQLTSGIALLCALAWVYFSLTANAGYVKALTDNLSTRDLDLRADSLRHLSKLSDSDNLRALRNVLRTGDREMVLFAIENIEALEAREALEDLRELLTNNDPAIRSAALAALAVLSDKEALKNIEALLADPEPQVRAAAAKAVGLIGDEESMPILSPLLHDPDKKTRAAAIAALFRACGLDGILLAGDLLKKMLDSTDVEERVLAIGILGSIRIKHFTPTLMKMMEDPSPGMRVHSVRALAKLKDPRATGALISALSDKATAHYAERGLLDLGPKAKSQIITAVASDISKEIRARLLKILSKNPDAAAIDAMLGALKDTSRTIRKAALEALSASVSDDETRNRIKPAIVEYIKTEINNIYTLKASAAVLVLRNSNKPPRIFTETIEELAVKAVDRCFVALSIIFDGKAMRSIRKKLTSDDPRLKPLALEALDNIASKDISKLITPLFEDREPKDTLALSKNITGKESPAPEDIYKRFCADASEWVRGCTAYAIGAAREKSLRPELEKLASDGSGFVGETAAAALKLLDLPESEVPKMLLTMEKILFLKTVPIFAGMTGEELRLLGEIVEEAEFKTDQTVFLEGEPGEDMYVIVSGSVQVFTGEGDGEKLIATLGERESLGEMAILDDEPRSASARAAADTTMLRIHREDFRELIREEPEVAFGIFRVFTGRIRQANIEQERAYAPMQGSV